MHDLYELLKVGETSRVAPANIFVSDIVAALGNALMNALNALVRGYQRRWKAGVQSAKGAAARRQLRKELASPFGGAADTATVLRVFLKRSLAQLPV